MFGGKEMIYGIVDVGSNTIRLSIYKYENNKVILLLNKKTMAGLAGYVKDGELSKAGIKRACEVLKAYREIVENFQIENVFTNIMHITIFNMDWNLKIGFKFI